MAGGGGSSDTTTQYVQSPQQRQLWKAMAPGIRDFRSFFQTGKPLWDLPAAPQIPDITSMMPQEGWWNALDPTIRAGIMEPWKQGENQLFEEFGSRGMGGSARGGASGAFGQAVSDYWNTKAMPSIEQQGWNMISPALNAGWQSEWANNQNMFAQQLQQVQYPWQAMQGLVGSSLGTPVVSQAGMSPWGSAAAGGLSGAVAGGTVGGMLSGAGSGAVSGSVVPGWGTLIGAGVGAVAGGLGGYYGAR